MLCQFKARPILLVSAGLLWTSAFLLAAGAGPASPLAGDLARGLGMGVGIGLELLGLVLLLRQKRGRDAPLSASRRP